MNEKWILTVMVVVFMLCEKVDARQWGDSNLEYGDVVVTIFEVAVIVVLVMCCVGMFQQYDGMEFFGWQPPVTIPVAAHEGCTSVQITLDDLRRVVKQELKKKDAQRLMTVSEEGYTEEDIEY